MPESYTGVIVLLQSCRYPGILIFCRKLFTCLLLVLPPRTMCAKA